MTRNEQPATSPDISPERVRELLEAGQDFADASELMGHAPASAEAYLGSEERVEALTLERDRLAHELRLLREAVGHYANIHHYDIAGCVWAGNPDEDAGHEVDMGDIARQALATASLSDDTPERSGGEA